jgi:hypothetical protein
VVAAWHHGGRQQGAQVVAGKSPSVGLNIMLPFERFRNGYQDVSMSTSVPAFFLKA